jgi:hypothetical protein
MTWMHTLIVCTALAAAASIAIAALPHAAVLAFSACR